MTLVTPVTNQDYVSEVTQPPLRKSALNVADWPKLGGNKAQITGPEGAAGSVLLIIRRL